MTQTTTTKRRGRPAKTEVQPESNASDLEVQMQEAAEANAAFAQENDKLAKENAELKAMMAKNNPAFIRKATESEELQQGQDHSFTFDDDNNIIQAKPEVMEDVARLKSKHELSMFMNEIVTVSIQESTTENADHAFAIEVGGKKEFFREGETKRVKRMFVEGLARAKKTTYRNQLKKDKDGDNDYEYIPKTGVRYPFSVLEDTPRGRAWLADVLRQP